MINVIKECVANAKAKSKKTNNKEVHHVVAKDDYRALITRKFIHSYGISEHMNINLVLINARLHRHLHTNSYFAAVDFYLRICATTQGSCFMKRESILSGIALIGFFLYTMSQFV